MTNPKATALIQHYSDENLWKLINDRNRGLTRAFEPLWQFQDESHPEVNKLGEIEFSPAESLMVCSVAVAHSLNERSGKKAQYDLAKKILAQYNNDLDGIFVFHDPEGKFRFSLIYRDFVGNRQKLSNYRRFTYYVSPDLTNKTFLQHVAEGDFSTLDKIKEAFSVEKVTNKFFEEFRVIFSNAKKEFETANENTVCLWLKSKYSKEDYEEQVNKFTFTFLGRIIFLYFLLRKGWIENQSDYIRKVVEDETNSNLYLGVFEPLFFEVFARPESDRSPEIKNQYKNTPYLNGGLFEHSDLEAQLASEGKFILYRDGFLRKLILEFFEVYNFTVDENSFTDAEVSIDPEMLGKVFENTLAEEERNKKGTFYTPREIVHFMVKDSLRQYLFNETSIPLNLLQTLIYSPEEGTGQLSSSQIRLIDSKLENIKVLDPAVGSAAFPVEFLNVLIELRKRLNVSVGVNVNEVALKKHMIKNNLYGVDIDPGAIEIAKLRLWLALIVDYDKSLTEPLPNLDFKFRVGNSLQEKVDDLDIFNVSDPGQINWLNANNEFDQLKSRMIGIKDQFFAVNDEQERHRLKNEFDNLEHQLIRSLLKKYQKEFSDKLNNQSFKKFSDSSKITFSKINSLEQKIKDGTYKLFKPDFHFSEVFDRLDSQGNQIGGFDIVIGNPPYGVSVEDEIKEWHGLGSRDSYGVFISTALKRYLKPKGVLEFIVSDTWLTIKTHKPLREQVLSKQLHKVIRLHQDCFEATVNACIISITNQADGKHQLIAADLTNISTRDQVETLRAYLYDLDSHIGESTPLYGVYAYEQNLVNVNSNQPIFVGSPKLFSLMQDIGVGVVHKAVAGKRVPVRQIQFNGQLVELVRFGDIAEVKQGLATADNKAYLFQNPEARGSYRSISEYQEYLLTETDLLEIATNDPCRLKVINKGIHKSRDEQGFDNERWFGGRYIVPYDKGGESDTDTGWLPNYYVPTNYFIDWSTWAVNRLKTHVSSKQGGKIGSRFQNAESYFLQGITYSDTGFYAPTFRLNSLSIYDVMGMTIFTDYDLYQALSILCSKLCKYLIKNYINHSVHTQVEGVKPIPFVFVHSDSATNFIKLIIENQKKDLRYDYSSNEQKQLDKLIYQIYGLNKEDVQEVESWYARRYPKLAQMSEIN